MGCIRIPTGVMFSVVTLTLSQAVCRTQLAMQIVLYLTQERRCAREPWLLFSGQTTNTSTIYLGF